MTFHVDSEIGQLHQAIVHRPGLELSRLTPDNIGELLFDDVMWAAKAKEQHDAFAEALRDKGVEVHYYGQLLGETLELAEGREFVLDRVCTPEILGPSLVDPVRRLFDDLDGKALAEFLIGGILKADLHPLRAHSLKWDMLKADDFILHAAAQPPVPAGQLVLDVRRSDHQPDGQAGPPARDAAHAGPSTASTRSSPPPTS